MGAQDKVIEWLRGKEELLAEARKIADGDEFDYGDHDLAETLHVLLYGTELDEWLGDPLGPDHRARDALAAKVAEDEFFCIDWEEVRNILLADQR